MFLQSSRMILRLSGSSGARLATKASTPNFLSQSFSSSSDEDYIVGRVHRFDRKGCFGHIKAENASRDAPDIFVHRSGIASDLPTEKFPFNPFLRPDERVKFKVRQQDDGRYEAFDVTFANGNNIPPLRHGYLASRVEGAKKDAANSLITALEEAETTGEELSSDRKIQLVDDFLSVYREKVNEAEQRIVSMGLKVEDFPRVFERNNNQQNRKGGEQQQTSRTNTASEDPLESLMKSLDQKQA